MARHRASHRRGTRCVPAAVHETLLWGCFSAVLVLIVRVLSGTPVAFALLAVVGLLGLAVMAYGILRLTDMRLEHLDREERR